tara:strand:+ start:590 stop:2029 length:1440 start_codon:yes stop_codon:yes gene_type:complete
MPYYGDGSNLTGVEDDGARDDIALLGFQVAANGSLARYNLVDQSIDAFEDASGIDASTSTNEFRNAAGNYYSGSSTTTPTVTGGTVTTSGDYTFHAFTSTGSTNLVNDTAQNYTFAIVAGGGGCGYSLYHGGGGGGGGVVYGVDQSKAAGTYAMVVGAGGAGAGSGATPTSGADSTGFGFTASGGGAGASHTGSVDALDGGSGGGGLGNGGSASILAGGATDQDTYSGTTDVTGYGTAGGDGSTSASNYGAGGGGGATVAGANGSSSVGGAGGAGVFLTIFNSWGTDSSNGAAVGTNGGYFGGGGGGSSMGGGSSSGGVGGGGAGSAGAGTDGLANTGGGGGGSERSVTATGKSGGEGVIVVRRLTSAPTYADMTLVSNAQTAESVPTKGDVVMTYSNGAGTATLNTDIKAYVSRDSGANYTQATLVSQGTTGGHEIVTTHGLDISSQPSGTAMRFKITTHNQSAAKDTRVNAVSLGWA